MSLVIEPTPARTEEPTVRMIRDAHIAGLVVFVDGLPGCGKTLLTSVVGSLARVECMRYNYALEWVCVLRYLNAIPRDTAVALIRNLTDLDAYNTMMSRETNFRPTDLSGVFMNSSPWRYVRRLFLPDGDAVVERIRTERPILHLATHGLLGLCRPWFDALGEQCRIVEVVRHPLYMIKQIYTWMPRIERDPRIFALMYAFQGSSVPWFALGWEQRYLRSGLMDRAIYTIEAQWRAGERMLQTLSTAERNRILLIPFEQFVIRPEPFLASLEQFLGTTRTTATRRTLRRQHVPRKMFADGVGLKIYRKYGWQPSRAGATEADELRTRRELVAQHASADAMTVLDRLCAEYEATYLGALVQP